MAHKLSISRRDIEHATHLATRALRHRDPAHPAASSGAGKAVQAFETLGASFVSGVLKGKYGPMSVGPVPVDLGLAAALTVAGFGLSEKYGASHMLNVGIGLGAGYTHAFGAGLGSQWGASGKTGPQNVKVSGALGRGTAPLTEAELRAMATAVRR